MYKIDIGRSAAKELRSLPGKVIKRVVKKIDGLEEDPRPPGSKKLKGTSENLWRIRIGSYRVVYSIDDRVRIIDIVKIGHRKDIYE